MHRKTAGFLWVGLSTTILFGQSRWDWQKPPYQSGIDRRVMERAIQDFTNKAKAGAIRTVPPKARSDWSADQKCSIPLVRVRTKDTAEPLLQFQAHNTVKMPEVTLPAPPCQQD